VGLLVWFLREEDVVEPQGHCFCVVVVLVTDMLDFNDDVLVVCVCVWVCCGEPLLPSLPGPQTYGPVSSPTAWRFGNGPRGSRSRGGLVTFEPNQLRAPKLSFWVLCLLLGGETHFYIKNNSSKVTSDDSRRVVVLKRNPGGPNDSLTLKKEQRFGGLARPQHTNVLEGQGTNQSDIRE
jgi:hypothetical protein